MNAFQVICHANLGSFSLAQAQHGRNEARPVSCSLNAWPSRAGDRASSSALLWWLRCASACKGQRRRPGDSTDSAGWEARRLRGTEPTAGPLTGLPALVSCRLWALSEPPRADPRECVTIIMKSCERQRDSMPTAGLFSRCPQTVLCQGWSRR